MLKWGHVKAFLWLRGPYLKLGIFSLKFNVRVFRIGGLLATPQRSDPSAQRAHYSARTTVDVSIYGWLHVGMVSGT